MIYRAAPSRSPMWSRMRVLVGNRRGMVVILAITSVLSGLAEAAVLATIAQVATALVDRASRVNLEIGPLHLVTDVWTLLLIAAGLAVVRIALQVPTSALPARLAADVQAQLRTGLFYAFTRASWEVQSRDREGHLQEMMTSQVVQASQGALQVAMLITASLTFLVLVVSALALNVLAAAGVLGAAVVLFALLRPLTALGGRHARALSAAQMEYAGGVGEGVRVAEETQVFGVAAAQRARIDSFVFTAQDLFFRTQFLGRLIPNVYQGLVFLMIVAGLAGLYGAGAGHIASLGAVVLLLVRAGTFGQQVQGSYQYVRQALPFVERLQQAERGYLASAPTDGGQALRHVRAVAFENVSYAYRPGRAVLKDISFNVLGGETIGIVGPSGAGKSTLVQILLQLRAPDDGQYLVNGVPANGFTSEDWHARVAYVPQEPRLIYASVADNIRYYREINKGAVERAARLARIHDDIVGWPNGYDTIVGPRADAVSGGQQQRICLARALAAQPQILVLDEPTSALDPRSESLIQESLVALEGEVTLFIVAHRMSTLDICGRVMVIVDGRLEAFNAVDFLHRDNGYYRSAVRPPAIEVH
jgi:ABC-type multidrug transport system fused ATPase/permease subunit